MHQDEIDAIATSRVSSEGDSGSSHEGVLTSLLNEMDGVQELLGVTVIAATNRPESLVRISRSPRDYLLTAAHQDSALMRPGRLDRILYVGPPDKVGREEILRIRMKEMAVDPTLNVKEIANLVRSHARSYTQSSPCCVLDCWLLWS